MERLSGIHANKEQGCDGREIKAGITLVAALAVDNLIFGNMASPPTCFSQTL